MNKLPNNYYTIIRWCFYMKTLTYKRVIIISCLLSIILGIFLHFAYNLSNENILVGLISPVNESIWEHLKLIFVPFTLFGIIFYFYTKDKLTNTLLNTFLGNIVGMFSTVTVFYLFNNLLNIKSMLVGILSYALGLIFAYTIFYLGIYDSAFKSETSNSNILGVCTLTLMFVLFITSTFAPIKTNIFKDPITKTYGIYNKS